MAKCYSGFRVSPNAVCIGAAMGEDAGHRRNAFPDVGSGGCAGIQDSGNSAHPRYCSSVTSVYAIGNSPDNNVDECMEYGGHVLERQCLRVTLFSFDRANGDFLERAPLIEQHAYDVCLESKSTCVRMPAHNVIAKMNGEPVIVIETKAAYEIHQRRVGIR